MQITSALSSNVMPMPLTSSAERTTSASTTVSGVDQASLKMTSATFSSLVQEAQSYPEVRSEVVAAYQAQVASGHYPPVSVIAGLADLLSGQVQSD
jgi:hypothetical protein